MWLGDCRLMNVTPTHSGYTGFIGGEKNPSNARDILQ